MKKRYILIIAGIICSLILVFIVAAKSNPKFMMNEVKVGKWNNPDSMHTVCRTNVKGKVDICEFGCAAGFTSKSKREDMSKTNQEEYIGEMDYVDECLKYPASLFFADNNYYVIFYEKTFDTYWVKNCYLDYRLNDSIVYVPSPVYINIDYDIMRMYYEETGENSLDFIFENYSFEEAEKFYKRISEEYVSIDSESKQITIDGYDLKKEKIVNQCITIDFNKKVIIGINKEGKYDTITGIKDKKERKVNL